MTNLWTRKQASLLDNAHQKRREEAMLEAGLRSNTAYEFQQSGRTFTRINGLWDSCVTYLRWQKKSRLPRPPIIYAQIRYSSITLLSYIPLMFPRFYRSVPFSFSPLPSLPPFLPFFLSSYNPFLPSLSSLRILASLSLSRTPPTSLSPSLSPFARLHAKECAPRLRASERVSVYSTGSPWGSEVGYRVRERKRGRGGWAWFVFEVESTLHLLLYPISTKFLRLRIRHGILKLLKISIHTRGTRHSRVYVEWVPGYSLIYALIDGMNFVIFKWTFHRGIMGVDGINWKSIGRRQCG